MNTTKQTIQALFIDGPRANETGLVPIEPPNTYDCEICTDSLDEYEVRPGQEFGLARFEPHRYRLAGMGRDASGDPVALYEHVGALVDGEVAWTP